MSCEHTTRSSQSMSLHAVTHKDSQDCSLCNVKFKGHFYRHLETCRVLRSTLKGIFKEATGFAMTYLQCKICGVKPGPINHTAVMIQHCVTNHFGSKSGTGRCSQCSDAGELSLVDFLCHFFREHCEKQSLEDQAANRAKMQKKGTKPTLPSQCEICSKMCSSLAALKNHLAVHSTERPFKCDVCQKSFKTKCRLAKHKNMVHVERSFTCEFCGDRFKMKHQLTGHLLVHGNVTLHKCDVCGKEFKRPHTLRNHKLTHAAKEFQCELCDKEFLHGWQLRLHKRDQHPDPEINDPKYT